MMSDQRLWSDDRISRELGAVTDAMVDYASSFNVRLDVALKLAKKMRDEYEEHRKDDARAAARTIETIEMALQIRQLQMKLNHMTERAELLAAQLEETRCLAREIVEKAHE